MKLAVNSVWPLDTDGNKPHQEEYLHCSNISISHNMKLQSIKRTI